MKHNPFRLILWLLSFAGLSFMACRKSTTLTGPVQLPADASAIIQSNAHFAFDFFHATLQNDAGLSNKLVSPISVYFDLAMLENGAKQATQDSILYAMRLAAAQTPSLNATAKALLQQLPLLDSKISLSIANSIWYDQSIQPVPSFLQTNDSFYNAQVQGLNFNDPASLTTINNWVSQETKGNIPQILNQLLPGSLILLNAVYFNGSWSHNFDTAATKMGNFTNVSGQPVNTPFMSLLNTVNYMANDTVQMLQLPYGGGDFNMYLMKPGTALSTAQLANYLSPSTFGNWQSKLDSTLLQLYLPRFGFGYSIPNLQPELGSMGMGIAFSNLADLSGIFPQGASISQSAHKTMIKVSETGTTAAAVTVITVMPTAILTPNYPIISFDHPFLFLIQEKSTGTVLFIGLLNDPSQS